MQNQLARSIWISTITIMIMGLVSLYSASYHNLRVSQDIFYDQLFCAAAGLLIMFLLSNFDYRRFYDIAYVFYALGILLLALVLVVGRNILGAKRWLEIGSFNFQPSELIKLVMILALARYFSQQRIPFFSGRHSLGIIVRDLLLPLSLMILPMFLVFKQPDLGTTLLLFGTFTVMLFASGLELKYLFSFLGICLACLPFMWHLLKPYQKDRLLVFLNPNIDPLGAGYTIIQSKIAIGSGLLLGKGWLSGTQNQLNFLPERHTDFIFSVIGEEWGLFGTLLVVVCFFTLIKSIFKIAQGTKDKFGHLMAVGIGSIFTLQVITNIGMTLGLCPVVGLTLPFVSYGRSSFIVFVIMLGIILNLNKNRTIF